MKFWLVKAQKHLCTQVVLQEPWLLTYTVEDQKLISSATG